MTQVLGVEVPWDAIERYLVAIGATAVSKPEDGRIAVDVPGWRPDLVAEIDLIEEIARLHGFDNFPTELRPFRVGELPSAVSEGIDGGIRRGLVAEGLFEVADAPAWAGGWGRQRPAAQPPLRGGGIPPDAAPAGAGPAGRGQLGRAHP